MGDYVEEQIERAGGSEGTFVGSFYIGDKVRPADRRFNHFGQVGTVAQVSHVVVPQVEVTFDDGNFWYNPADLELAEPEFVNQKVTIERDFFASPTGAQKELKPARHSLIPSLALNLLAEHYGKGAAKYGDTPDEPNWRKGYAWSQSYDALMRHATAFWGGEDSDPETGLPHMSAVAFHAFSLLTFMQEHPEFDDRYKGAVQ